jgi:FecR protein
MTPRVVIRKLSLLGVIIGFSVNVPAAQLKEARVTQVVKDVKLLPTGAAARPAAISDEVRDGTAVRTGVDSRSELRFTDQTLARLGANTLFSFSEGTRNLNLQDGAMLLRVPKGAGGAKINSSAVTAAITGTTVMVETHVNEEEQEFLLQVYRVGRNRPALFTGTPRRVDLGESRANDHHAGRFENDPRAGGRRYWQDHAKLPSGHRVFDPARERSINRF